MDFRIGKNDLLRGLYLTHGIADRKSTIPILANVLLRTEGKDKAVFAATDLKVAMLATGVAKVADEGAITVGARQLYEIAKGLGGEEVRLQRSDQN
jgi:DNA polymerase III subunit beta